MRETANTLTALAENISLDAILDEKGNKELRVTLTMEMLFLVTFISQNQGNK